MRFRFLKYKLTAILCIFISLLEAQNWDSLRGGMNNFCRVMYADTVDNYLYAAGMFSSVDHNLMKGIARWNGSQWDSLKAGIDGLDLLNADPQNTWAISKYNSKIYVGGVFASLGNIPAKSLGTWDGSAWDSLSVPPFKSNLTGAVYALEPIGSELYMGGVFDSVASMPCKGIAKWNNVFWTCLPFPLMSTSISINAICEYNGEIYAAGNFESPLYPNDTIQDIIKYDGTNWLSVGGGMHGSMTNVETMAVYNGELYVAGLFTISEGNIGNYIQRWDGNNWSDVGGGVMGLGMGNGQIHKLQVFESKLFAFGVFEVAGGVSAKYVASWDGTDWCGYGDNLDNIPLTSCVYNDSLYMGGAFWTINGDSIKSVAKFIGVSADTCGNTTGVNETEAVAFDFNLYPNPTNSSITLAFETNSEKASFSIMNYSGQVVMKKEDLKTIKGKNEFKIDLNDLSNGIYLIQVQTGSGITSKKIIKN